MIKTNKTSIPGAILIFSCHKHKETRLKQFKLSKTDYNGWKVFIIIGNPNLKSEYEMNDNVITIKCEDSYIHILKKVILGCKIILNLYDIQHGILRCGDDLIFNEDKLSLFLNNINKTDYMGLIANYIDKMYPKYNNFMPDYFNSHPEDLKNPLNCIPYTLDEMRYFNVIPHCTYTGGVVVYLSVNSCNILINHMEKINWDVFQSDKDYGYPYIIEDIGVGFILSINNIKPLSYNLYSDNKNDALNINHPAVAYHTNMYK
jgi:hypothetical protein